MEECKYCNEKYQHSWRTIVENEHFFANLDNHPVSPGHMKLISKRHVNSICELTDAEIIAMRDLMAEAQGYADRKYKPDGYNLGINQGEAAGQTVFHLHVHVIPRYNGDVANPIGGVRNIIAGMGDYTKR